ncbi:MULTISPECIES: YwiC-like family protein [unclassified Bacillus (in: firmicutes)]|uniref:YwiC-like family protein n=1 Tax=unclassified Bacillus (in: firmicutes) TaxID=185979 RepID=UPI001BE8CA8E|nr:MULTISPECIES: YwiC-like family protein [unclassified Bacillus (in: firmicutes)]MBT2639182.1 YwiC-like family protein [Bacillus sp. ISL-39]MBT2659888.1 YwiC-like family protein [Bacillus sp. ISL-45]
MKLFMPKQHGAWAMLIIPFWLGAAASELVWQHVPFFIGWLLLYLGTYPLLLMFKKKKIPFYRKWALTYIIPALLFLMVPLFMTPTIVTFGLAMIPFFMINAYFSAKNKDRALLNDLSAIVVFSIAGLASSYLANGEINENAILVFAASILFFTGSTFYVKTMIREKKNSQFKWISWSYHLLVPVLWLVAGEAIVAAAAIPSFIRAMAFYGKPLSVMKVGIYEIVNAALFFIIMLFAIL